MRLAMGQVYAVSRRCSSASAGADASTVLAVVYAAPCTTSNYRILAEGIVQR